MDVKNFILFIYSFIHVVIYSFIYLFIHSFIYLFIVILILYCILFIFICFTGGLSVWTFGVFGVRGWGVAASSRLLGPLAAEPRARQWVAERKL